MRSHSERLHAQRNSTDPMEKLARIADKTDKFTLYILQILHTLFAGCSLVSLLLLPLGELGDPQGRIASSSLDINIIQSASVIPISASGNVYIPSDTQVCIEHS